MLAAQTVDAERRRDALGTLCVAYWAPIYAFVRRRGLSPEDAADLTQAFFLHLVESHRLAHVDPALGRFRSFLLAAVKNFLANEWDRGQAQKRGGHLARVDFDTDALERRYKALHDDALDPDRMFERQWAHLVLERAADRLRQQQDRAGKGREFALLGSFLTSDAGGERAYKDVAAELGTTEPAVRTAVHRLRLKFGTCLREEIAETVSDAVAADAELRHVLIVAAA